MVKRTTITHMEYYAITTSIKAGKNNQVEKLIAYIKISHFRYQQW
jgi:hypothetical protein